MAHIKGGEIMKNIVILQCKNKYNYTIKQVRINYENKTFQIGNFTIGADKTLTRKAMNEKLIELKLCGFTQID